MSDIEAIKAKLSILEVVSSYVQLKKAGRSYKGLCPFHQEKTPSFIVSPDKDIAYCFGCRKGGDIFAFVQEVEGVDFPETIRILAERAGVQITQDAVRPISREKDVLYELQEAAARFFESTLREHADASSAREYLDQRGVREETIREFRLGFSLAAWDALTKFLRSRGYADEQLIAAGLCIARDKKSDGVYDRFRGRIMFPLYNAQGRLVGFSGRLLVESEHEPKYLNSSDTAIFHKSSVLYGFPAARDHIRSRDSVLFVEGQMDVIALHQAGYRHSVATSGTALTTEHLRIAKRFTPNILFAFDRDRAGIEATKRALDLAAHLELTASVVVTPGGKDPDEALRTDATAFAGSFEKPLDPVSFYCDVCFVDANLSDIAVKKALTTELFSFIGSCVNTVEQEHHLQVAGKKLGIALPILQREFERGKKTVRYRHPEPEQQLTVQHRTTEAVLLGFLLQYPALMSEFERLSPSKSLFSEPFLQVYNKLKDHYNSRDGEFELKGFLKIFNDRDRDHSLATQLATRALFAEEQYGALSDTERLTELHSLVSIATKKTLREQLQQLTLSLRAAERTGDQSGMRLLLQQKQALIEHFGTSTTSSIEVS